MDLIKLTIKFPEGDNQIMVLEKDSEAYKHMLIYAETNEGETSEEPYLNETDHSIICVALQHYIDEHESDIESPVREGNEEIVEFMKVCITRAKQALEKLA